MAVREKIRSEDYHRHPYFSLVARSPHEDCETETQRVGVAIKYNLCEFNHYRRTYDKTSIGKLQINFDPIDLAEQSVFELLDFSGQDALQLKDLPFHHLDPFDRMLISQSITTKYPIMTDDDKIRLYQCQVI